MATRWFDYWQKNSVIPLDRVFDDGGVNLQLPDDTAPGTLRLRSRLGNKGELIGFRADIQGAEIKPAWDGVSLAPMGFEPLVLVGTPLPVWLPDKSLESEYRTALMGLEERLAEDETPYFRLEGYFPVTDAKTGSFNIDRVRIVLIPGLVYGNKDLALVLLTLQESHGLSARQDGGGSGPPKPP